MLYTHPDGIELRNPNRKPRHYRFDQVRFLAHDGVPLRQLRGYSEPDDELLGRLDRAARSRDTLASTKRTHRPVRRPLPHSSGVISWKKDQIRSVRFGDPWDVEAIEPRLYQHPDWRETCVVFGDAIERSHGGNAGILWDLGSILEVA